MSVYDFPVDFEVCEHCGNYTGFFKDMLAVNAKKQGFIQCSATKFVRFNFEAFQKQHHFILNFIQKEGPCFRVKMSLYQISKLLMNYAEDNQVEFGSVFKREDRAKAIRSLRLML